MQLHLAYLANAASIHSRRWTKYFADIGHRVDILSGGVTPDEMPVNVRLIQLEQFSGHLPNRSALRQLRSIRKYVRQEKPDILHAHYAGVNGLMGTISGARPYIITAWGSDILITGQTRTVGALVRHSLRRCNLITCDAEHMKESMIEMGVPKHKIEIILFGTDTQLFSPGPKNEEFARGLGLDISRPIILSLRSFEPIYDLKTLVRAVPIILNRHPDTQVVFAGGGSLWEELKAFSAGLGISESLFFPGPLPGPKLPLLLRIADTYVSTSLSDAGLAGSTAEAMSCGKCVVITDSGENRSWVDDGLNGWVVPCSEPRSLADAVIRSLDDDELRSRFGKLARKEITERNNVQVEMSRMNDLYLRVMRDCQAQGGRA